MLLYVGAFRPLVCHEAAKRIMIIWNQMCNSHVSKWRNNKCFS